jgi:predicted ribosome quality control (RQC) complex YloA/Tae2 family protein
MTPLSALLGTRIRRIDAPHEELLSIVLSGQEERTVLVFSFAAAATGVGLVPNRPHGRPASSFVQKLRKELEGARLVGFNQPDHSALELVAQRGDIQRRLVCDFAAPRISILDEASTLLADHTPHIRRAAKPIEVAWPESIETLAARGPLLLSEGAAGALAQRRAQLAKLVRTGQKRLERRLLALVEDAQRTEQAAPLRTRANLVMTNLHAIKRGAASVRLLDYTQDPPDFTEIELDQAHSAQAQAEAWFKQARRFERGAQLALQRRAATLIELGQLTELTAQLSAADESALDQLAQAARALGVRGIGSAPSETPNRSARAARHKPYRELRGHNQRTILVGKGAEDNDALTREHARPQDLWLHARDVPGAHVIVPLERNETCPQELLLDAAHLAAHFSDARNQPIVDISYTPKRYVRKPRNAPKGTAQLEREKVLTLHPDPTRLSQLLKSEIHD